MTLEKIGRNDPCPCGSGKKYKQCCQRLEVERDAARAAKASRQPSIQAGLAHHQAGRLQEAEATYRQILQAVPDHPEALHLSGLIAYQSGRTDVAIELIRKAIGIGPSAEMHFNLGVVYQGQGKTDAAVDSYRQSLSLDPSYVKAHSNLGNLLHEQGNLEAAIRHYQQAILLDPDYAPAHNNLGNVRQDQGKLDEALTCYQKAIALMPNLVHAYNNIGNVRRKQGKLDEAILHYQKALAYDPNYADAHSNLGTVLQAQGKFRLAEQSYRKALALMPEFAEVYNNLGGLLQSQGQLEEAIACYRRTLQIKPQLADAHSNLIFTLDLTDNATTAELQAERKRWNTLHAAPLAVMYREHANLPEPERRLRIGYVSADFREHSAAAVFGSMLVKFERSRFDVFAYSNTVIEDTRTQLFRQSVTCWRNIVGQSDDAVCGLIRQDEIDILVDLSGHSEGNRLLVFARKPAPIQVTAWGHASGTGMHAMDVFFSDPVMVPPDEAHLFAEEVRYLPNALGYFVPQPFPEVSALPALAARAVSFGSFNRLTKISDHAFKVWAKVLNTIPDSRFVLKTPELDDPAVRERVAGHFVPTGIAPERIVMLGRSSWNAHMEAFNQVDIVLDPFPHGGGVTSVEGLMMGVPLITLRWPTIAGRVSSSILTTLGLSDWIAETPEQYVDLALRKARDLGALQTLRTRLRSMMTDSVLGDSAAYTAAVEHEYRLLWRRWCAQNNIVDG